MNVTLTMKRFKSIVDPLLPQIIEEMEHSVNKDHMTSLNKVLVIVETIDAVTDLTFAEMDAYLHTCTGYSLGEMQIKSVRHWHSRQNDFIKPKSTWMR